ncbi:MAG: DUF2877 domain-containing protein [Anaerolineales bacterium]
MKSSARRLRVACMAPRAKNWLKEARQAHVLYAFERVINFVNQEGDVLSLVENSIGNGPFSLLMAEGPFPDNIQVGVSLLAFENGFWLDDWLIDAESATLWEPRPDWDAARRQPANLKLAAQLITDLLREHAEVDSFAQLILDPTANSPLPARILQAAEQNIPLLLSGIQQSDLEALTLAAKGLAGLGPGLTPAGDDLLLGVLLGIWAVKTPERAMQLSAAIVRTAAPRTHALAAAWLTAGAAGEAAAPWHELVNAITVGDTQAVQIAAMSILPTGHTSGADALGGFLGVIKKTV